MPKFSKRRLSSLVKKGRTGPDVAVRGRALEDLVCYLFETLPGITVTTRNSFNAKHSEEIDVAFWNEQHPRGLRFLPNIILVECKNWSKPVGSEEVSWFDSKLKRRGLPFGILIAANGITGDSQSKSAAHDIVSAALTERRQLVVISTDEILGLVGSEHLCSMVKRKLCELAVMGTVLSP